MRLGKDREASSIQALYLVLLVCKLTFLLQRSQEAGHLQGAEITSTPTY